MLVNGPPFEFVQLYNFPGWLPTSVAQTFEFPVEYGFGGAGQVVSIIGSASAAQSDLNAYVQANNIAAAPTYNVIQVVPNGVVVPPSQDDIDEATLDAETVAGLAPLATINALVVSQVYTQAFEAALTSAVQDVGSTVVSISYSGCESSSAADDFAFDQIAQEAAATGITIVASAGDSGPTCYSSSGALLAGVGEPSSDPYVVSAGGSEDLISAANDTTPSAISQSLLNPAPWNDSKQAGGGSAGGGISAAWPIPAYQNAPGIVSTSGSKVWRNIPDISMPASNDSGPTAVYVNGAWTLYGGTSWSAPAFAAMQAEINQQCGGNPRWGLPDLYRVYYQAPKSFVDITTGNISWPGFSLTYSAGPGYDNASGLGLPLGEQIAVQDGC